MLRHRVGLVAIGLMGGARSLDLGRPGRSRDGSGGRSPGNRWPSRIRSPARPGRSATCSWRGSTTSGCRAISRRTSPSCGSWASPVDRIHVIDPSSRKTVEANAEGVRARFLEIAREGPGAAGGDRPQPGGLRRPGLRPRMTPSFVREGSGPGDVPDPGAVRRVGPGRVRDRLGRADGPSDEVEASGHRRHWWAGSPVPSPGSEAWRRWQG